MAWVDLSAAFGYGTILTSTQMQNLRDNIAAMANNDSGAPEIVRAAIADSELLTNIKTGTYTGDDTESQEITGIGFQPKYVIIWKHPTGEITAVSYEKLDQTWADYAVKAGASFLLNHINSLDSDGFTVDDDGTDDQPNKLDEVYDYLALG